jgi:hypothetical protein
MQVTFEDKSNSHIEATNPTILGKYNLLGWSCSFDLLQHKQKESHMKSSLLMKLGVDIKGPTNRGFTCSRVRKSCNPYPISWGPYMDI